MTDLPSSRPAASEVASEPRVTRRTWIMFALLIWLFALASVDRSLVSILAEQIKHAFGLSDGQLGVLTGLMFSIPYVLVGLPIGLLIDRYNRVLLLLVMATAWAGATILAGLMTSYLGMLAARALLGMSESGMAPAFTSLTSDLFPRSRRSTSMALLYVSTPMGLMIGYYFGGMVGAHYGWRAAFVLAGILGILTALPLLALREPLRGAFDPPDEGAEILLGGSRFLATMRLFRARPALVMIIAGASCAIAAQSGVSAFAAPYFIRIRHLPLQQASLILALEFGIAGAIGILGGGWISDRLRHRRGGSELLYMALVPALNMLAVIATFSAPSLTGMLDGFTVYSLFVMAGYGVIFATFVSLTPPELRGLSTAILLIFQNLVGYGFGPPITGLLSDRYGHAGFAEPLRLALITMSSFYAAASLCFLIAAYLARRGRILAEDASR
jgi:predicted MFS family arabinose efflux permease